MSSPCRPCSSSGPRPAASPPRRALLRSIAVSYIAFNLGGWVLSASYLRPTLSFMRPLHLVLPFFLSNIPPLLLFGRYLKRFPLGAGLPVPDEDVLRRFAERFGVSAREMEILEKILQGKTNKEIERELFISSHTVKNHLYNAYQKLGVKSRLQAVRLIHDSEKTPRS
jgi:LuxR family transcriptional regulator of spore coat protein